METSQRKRCVSCLLFVPFSFLIINLNYQKVCYFVQNIYTENRILAHFWSLLTLFWPNLPTVGAFLIYFGTKRERTLDMNSSANGQSTFSFLNKGKSYTRNFSCTLGALTCLGVKSRWDYHRSLEICTAKERPYPSQEVESGCKWWWRWIGLWFTLELPINCDIVN